MKPKKTKQAEMMGLLIILALCLAFLMPHSGWAQNCLQAGIYIGVFSLIKKEDTE